MKPLLTPLVTACICVFFAAASLQAQSTKTHASKAAMQNAPFTALYSSQFEVGDPALSMVVLNAWKMYDDNSFGTGSVDFIADTVHAEMPNGMKVNGRDSFVNAIKSYRGTLASAKSQVIAYTSLKSTDRHESLVAIWGMETDGKTDGTSATTDLHEVWVFNSAGKVVFFKQFLGGESKP